MLQKISNPESVSWPLVESWQNSALSLYVFPKDAETVVKTQTMSASFEFESKKYSVILGAN